jgi:hypothetical protein
MCSERVLFGCCTLTRSEQLLRRVDYFGKLIDGRPELLLQVADADLISKAINFEEESALQQGGVRYPTVSHGRTRMLPSSPIRLCAIADEKSLRLVYEVYEFDVEGAARRRRDLDMMFEQAAPDKATSAAEMMHDIVPSDLTQRACRTHICMVAPSAPP